MTDSFFRQALKGDNSWIWYFLATIGVVIAYTIGQIPILVIAFLKLAKREITDAEMRAFSESANFSLIGVDTTLGLALVILGFVTGLGALYLFVRYLHKRSFKSLITAFENIRWGRIWFAFGIWFAFTAVVELVLYAVHPDNYTFHFELSKFLPLLLVSLFLLPFQTSFEEIMLRGYALQGMGLWAKYRAFPILLTSVIFGLLHGFNPEIREFGFGVMMTYYISVGVFLAILTVMDEGLELALGIHAATNIYGAAFVSFQGSALQTDALFFTREVNAPLMFALFVVTAFIFLVWSKRKFGWGSFTKLTGRIQLGQNDLTDSELVNN